jgi:signal transduction histidine kinase
VSPPPAPLRALLPALELPTWERRHRLLVAVLLLHLPVLAVIGLVRGLDAQATPAVLGLELSVLGLLTVAGAFLHGRVPRMFAVTLGLMLSAAVVVHLSGGLVAAQFHFFVVLGLIALYHDWRPLLLAMATVVVHHGIVVVLNPRSVYRNLAAGQDPWVWALAHGGAVLVVGLLHVAFWRIAEQEQRQARETGRRLAEGEQAVQARLDAAEAVKSELFAVVAHEFRTPLTSILGFAHTLAARFDQLDRTAKLNCVDSIEGQARRLEWLVHNVLAASGEASPVDGAVVDLTAATETAVRGVARSPAAAGRVIHRDLPAGLRAAVDFGTADRIVTNLLDNAVKFGERGTPVWVSGRVEGDRVRFEVANVADPIPREDIERIFGAFVQLDSSDSRPADGIGLGLQVVRRLVEARGGRVTVRHDGRRVVFAVTLPATATARRPVRLPHRLPKPSTTPTSRVG